MLHLIIKHNWNIWEGCWILNIVSPVQSIFRAVGIRSRDERTERSWEHTVPFYSLSLQLHTCSKKRTGEKNTHVSQERMAITRLWRCPSTLYVCAVVHVCQSTFQCVSVLSVIRNSLKMLTLGKKEKRWQCQGQTKISENEKKEENNVALN